MCRWRQESRGGCVQGWSYNRWVLAAGAMVLSVMSIVVGMLLLLLLLEKHMLTDATAAVGVVVVGVLIVHCAVVSLMLHLLGVLLLRMRMRMGMGMRRMLSVWIRMLLLLGHEVVDGWQ
jgi:peptidoglycan biosynthesis protein MviN/MurJ (putative lipid II flippase)